MKDLFGADIPEADEVISYLREADKETINSRARNLSFICSIAPDGNFLMPTETYHVFTEARDAFVNGLYVGAILLSQAFIEHRLQSFMYEIGENKIAEKGLGGILRCLMVIRPNLNFILNKIDQLRMFRNPFTHLKSFDHPYTITQVALAKGENSNLILYEKAKDAIALMYTVATIELR